MNNVKIIGIGPGHPDYILPIAYKEIEQSDILVGGKRNLEVFSTYNKQNFYYDGNLEEIVDFVKENRLIKKIAVIVSGDTGFYSLLDYFKKYIGEENIEVIPGISSFQYLFSKIKCSWKEYGLFSMHGRTLDIIKLINDYKGIFLLTDKVNSPDVIARKLINGGYKDIKMIVGENLSYSDERIIIGKANELIEQKFSNLSVVVIEKDELE